MEHLLGSDAVRKRRKGKVASPEPVLVLKQSQHIEYVSCACLMAYSLRNIVSYLIHTPKNFYPLEGFLKNTLKRAKTLKLYRNCSLKKYFFFYLKAS